jgi:hypothetical protein
MFVEYVRDARVSARVNQIICSKTKKKQLTGHWKRAMAVLSLCTTGVVERA